MPRKRNLCRNRPRKLIHDAKDHSIARRRWRSWLPKMMPDLSDLLGKKEIFWELQGIAKQNPEILTPGAFFDWMCRNYMTSVAIGIRSFGDLDRRSHSLGRLLYEIIERPGSISRRSHVSLYRGMPDGAFYGNSSFDHIAGANRPYLSYRIVRHDLRDLEDTLERIRLYVNKRIAHRTGAGAFRKPPTLNQLDEALDSIDELYCKYNLLLTASGLTTCFATRQYNWRSVLYEPWIPDKDGLYSPIALSKSPPTPSDDA